MKAVAHIPAAEVVAHRIVWSVPIAGAVLVWLGRTADIKVALRSPRTLAMAALTAALITVNWGIYVWAIAVGPGARDRARLLHQPAVQRLSSARSCSAKS